MVTVRLLTLDVRATRDDDDGADRMARIRTDPHDTVM